MEAFRREGVLAAAPDRPGGRHRSPRSRAVNGAPGTTQRGELRTCKEELLWRIPQGVPRTHHSRLHPRIGLSFALKKRTFFFFFFPQTKINKQKNTPGSRPPGQLALAQCCVLPLNRNCEPWPATSYFSQSCRRGGDSPCPRLGAWPSPSVPGLSLPAPGLQGGPALAGRRDDLGSPLPCSPKPEN